MFNSDYKPYPVTDTLIMQLKIWNEDLCIHIFLELPVCLSIWNIATLKEIQTGIFNQASHFCKPRSFSSHHTVCFRMNSVNVESTLGTHIVQPYKTNQHSRAMTLTVTHWPMTLPLFLFFDWSYCRSAHIRLNSLSSLSHIQTMIHNTAS